MIDKAAGSVMCKHAVFYPAPPQSEEAFYPQMKWRCVRVGSLTDRDRRCDAAITLVDAVASNHYDEIWLVARGFDML